MRGDLEFMSLPRLVRTAAVRYGDREAVVEGRVRISYRQLGARVEQAAAGCLAAGVRAGDRVAVWAPNTLDWIVSALGAVTAGAVLVPVNTRLKGAEAAQVLGRTRATLLFVTGTFLGASYVAALRGAAGRGKGLRGPLPGLPHLRQVVVLADDAPAEFHTWKEFLAAGDAVPEGAVRARANAVAPDAPSDIMFTSGTTGEPKGVIATHAQTLRAFGAWSELAGLREGDRYLIVNPFSHSFGYKAGVIAGLMRGATMVPQAVFAVEGVLAQISAERISVLPGPPTLYQALLDHPARRPHSLSSLRLVVTGAAVVDRRLIDRLRDEVGVATVLTAYGMSEATGVVTMCRRDDPAEVVAETSGRALPDTEVKVVAADGSAEADETDGAKGAHKANEVARVSGAAEGEGGRENEGGGKAALPPGQAGEVLVRGYQVMSGYFEDPEATARAVDREGWLHTGDIGVLDAEGNLRITGRVKDMFVVGGFNVYPAEVEQVLVRHPGVAEAAVVGVPDSRLGEVGKAFAVRRAGARAVSGEELIAWARREMANYKVPRAVEFVAELPRNASGKVLKRKLR
ncbi:FadD3 family acyl-CoA ligase [Streptomyces sp. NPDC046215]|uniref:FadD3 family acyl-CoA ligase n=1 Tax=Streptomyces stramineus TaxID=173861 RepID=A0ABN1BFN0_9ACTN